MSNLNFKKNNPGAVLLGNFINYYDFHSPEDRAKMFPGRDLTLWEPLIERVQVRALDVGCNAGDLTVVLYDYLTRKLELNDCKILGLDIDPVLIERAQLACDNENITFQCSDFMSSPYFDSAFDITFCFSVTMWIHLNYGDEGLRRFVAKLCAFTEYLMIEPQPWKCYRRAVKRLKHSDATFPYFNQLRITQTVEKDIEYFIKTQNFEKIWESGRTKWNRKLILFKRKRF